MEVTITKELVEECLDDEQVSWPSNCPGAKAIAKALGCRVTLDRRIFAYKPIFYVQRYTTDKLLFTIEDRPTTLAIDRIDTARYFPHYVGSRKEFLKEFMPFTVTIPEEVT